MKRFNVKATEIDLQPVEDEITHFSDNEKVEVKQVNFEFVQNDRLHGINRKVTIFNDSHCYIWVRNKHRRKYKYRINLAFLEPKPFRNKIIAWKWLIAAIAFMIFDAVLVFSGWLDSTAVNFLIMFVAVSSAAIIFVLGFFYHSRDTVFFRSQHGKIRLLEMINNNPDNASFRRFIKKLVLQIINSKASKNLSSSKLLTQELQELRRLKDETVIPGKSYEKSKKLILKHKGFKNI